MSDMDATGFEKLKKILVTCSNMLWLSCGGMVNAEQPSFGAIEGLLGTMRQEDSSKRCIRLDFKRTKDP